MKSRILRMGLAVFLGLALGAAATTYYIDDNSNDGDVYTPAFTGNESNNGLSPSTPKLTLNNLLASTNLVPGDVVLIDAGTYTNSVVIGATVNGAAGNRILFQGVPITNSTSGGAIFSSTEYNNAFNVSGNYLHFKDIKTIGGGSGLYLASSSFGEYERVYCTGSIGNPAFLVGTSASNSFRRSRFATTVQAVAMNFQGGKGNYVENCILYVPNSAGTLITTPQAVSNMVNSILMGERAMAGSIFPDAGTRNILYGSLRTIDGYETLAELQRVNTNWYGNTVADPKFVDPGSWDFHLLSAAGFVSNGVWVTNAAVGFSPGIDFGPRE